MGMCSGMHKCTLMPTVKITECFDPTGLFLACSKMISFWWKGGRQGMEWNWVLQECIHAQYAFYYIPWAKFSVARDGSKVHWPKLYRWQDDLTFHSCHATVLCRSFYNKYTMVAMVAKKLDTDHFASISVLSSKTALLFTFLSSMILTHVSMPISFLHLTFESIWLVCVCVLLPCHWCSDSATISTAVNS